MCEEARELITALVDDELSDPERNSIEGHIRDCPKCRFIWEQEQALKREVRMVGAHVSAPHGLRGKVLSDRRIFPETSESMEVWKGLGWPARLVLRPAFVVALLVLLILPAIYLMRPTRESISLTALGIHENVVRGDIPLMRAESQQGVKERLFRSAEGRFAPMGYDLSMMDLRAVGGVVQELHGRKILVTVYDGNGLSVTCHTFLGTEKDAPDHATVFFDREKKVRFYTFSRGGINGVLHREGNLICILVSKMAMQDLLALARSKAQPT